MYISVIPRKSLIACISIIFYLKMNCDLTSQLTHFEHISNADVMFSLADLFSIQDRCRVFFFSIFYFAATGIIESLLAWYIKQRD